MPVLSRTLDRFCPACQAMLAARTTDDELTLLKALCEPCEALVAADRGPGWELGTVTRIDLATGDVEKRTIWKGPN